LRARDANAIPMLYHYFGLCQRHGTPDDRLHDVMEVIDAWQVRNSCSR
jgi:hypothetical protein